MLFPTPLSGLPLLYAFSQNAQPSLEEGIPLCDQMIRTLLLRYPDPGQFPYRSWCYPQGLMLWGMIHRWEQTSDKALRDYVLRYTSGHVLPDGTIPRFTGDSMDDMMAGSVLVWAFEQTGEPRYRLACEKIRQQFETYPRTAEGAFWHARSLPGQFWVDGVFMGQMFLLEYARVLGDEERCWQETVR